MSTNSRGFSSSAFRTGADQPYSLLSLDSTSDPCGSMPSLQESSDGLLSMKHAESDTLCITGFGYQSRAASTIAMIQAAVESLRSSGVVLAPFSMKTVNMEDSGGCKLKGKGRARVQKHVCNCAADFAYALPWDAPTDCKTRLVPDFTFWEWPEAGLLPNFTGVTNTLHEISLSAPETQRCGWAGNQQTNLRRADFIENFWSGNVDIIIPANNTGTGNGRISMEEQAKRWACMIDLPAMGYSGRVPMLLHTGRPLLMAERSAGHYVDRVFYSDLLVPMKHYIPVNYKADGIEKAVQLALSEEGKQIGLNAKELAMAHLTTSAAVDVWAKMLSDIKE